MAQQIQFDNGPQGQALRLKWLPWLRRIAGAGVLLYLMLHTTMILAIYFGPEVSSRWSLDYRQPWPRLLHLGLFFCLLVYTLDNARTLIIDLHPHGQHYERLSLYAVILIFCLLFIPSAALIILDTVVPY